MRPILFLFISLLLTSVQVSEDTEYTWKSNFDHMSLTLVGENQYRLVVSSCTFEIRCEGRFTAFGDSLVIQSKSVKENVDRGVDEQWRGTLYGRKMKHHYLKNFRYMIRNDSTIKVNEVNWRDLVFRRAG